MRVTMLEDKRVTTDGVNTIDAQAGETYNMGDGVAHDLITHGLAEPADGELLTHPGFGEPLTAIEVPADGTEAELGEEAESPEGTPADQTADGEAKDAGAAGPELENKDAAAEEAASAAKPAVKKPAVKKLAANAATKTATSKTRGTRRAS